MKPVLTSHDPSWKETFSMESRKILQALGRNVIAIHHIGSTAIPDVVAKPVIDVLVEVGDIGQVDGNASQMRNLQYESMGEYGIVGRRYFRRPQADEGPAFHVHVFEANSESALRHIAFRDYLLANPVKAREYSEIKESLVNRESLSKSDYQKAKAPFIEACIEEAIEASLVSL